MGRAGDGEFFARVIAQLDGNDVADLCSKPRQAHPLNGDFVFLCGPGAVHQQVFVDLHGGEVIQGIDFEIAAALRASDDPRAQAGAPFCARDAWQFCDPLGEPGVEAGLGDDDGVRQVGRVAIGMVFAQKDLLRRHERAYGVDADRHRQRYDQGACAVGPEVTDDFEPANA